MIHLRERKCNIADASGCAEQAKARDLRWIHEGLCELSFVPEFYKSSNFLMLRIPDAFCSDGLGGRHFDPNCSVVAIRHAVMA
jgi:hypothetical protein